MSDRRPAKIDFSSALDETPSRHRPDKITEHRAITEAGKHGFSGRLDTMKVDGRSLKRRGSQKVQMNMKVTPELRSRFLDAARAADDRKGAVVNLGDFLEMIFEHYERTFIASSSQEKS